jgi:hypothetical protein
MTAVGAAALADVLMSNTSVISIGMRDNYITDAGTAALFFRCSTTFR